MSRNPHVPPEAAVRPPTPSPAALEPAGWGRRLGNYLIDSLCQLTLATLLAAGIAACYSLDVDVLLAGPEQYAFIIAAVLMYYISCESLFGRTLGKLVTGTRTVTVAGGRPTFGQVTLRTLIRFAPFEAFSLLFHQRPVGWHDRWSGTRVVRL